MSDWRQIRSRAIAELDAGSAKKAFEIFSSGVAWPAESFQNALEIKDAFLVLSRIAVALKASDLAQAAREADPDDVDTLLELSEMLEAHDLYALSATVLARAAKLEPDEEVILFDLVQALDREGRHEDICALILSAPAQQRMSFDGRALLARHSILAGDITGARALLPGLQLDDRELASELEATITRADALRALGGLGPADLRGWHFVVHGAILLHESPYGRDEGMNGRYALLQDSFALCREALERLRAVLGAIGVSPGRVLVLPERSSEIVARAAAQIFDVPAVPWSPEDEGPGLIAAYDLALLPGQIGAALEAHRQGQILWSHATRWTDPFFVTPDITTLMYEVNRAPWDEQLQYDPQSQALATIPKSNDAPEVLASRITSMALDDAALADLPQLLALVRAALELQGAARLEASKSAGKRPIHAIGSPVKSARFGALEI
jgi:hypothetical protein